MTEASVTSKHYPLIIRSQTAEDIARLNSDRTWSVRWNAVIDQAYADPQRDNVTIRAICQVLLAGRDNFVTSDWEHECETWTEDGIVVGAYEADDPAFSLMGRRLPIAWVSQAGKWSVDWSAVRDTRDLEDPGIQMGGFCDLMLAARDRFLAVTIKRETQ